ncbi:MAG TPA: family 16 glycoside hydrolase [Nitrospirota bacterium]|nr:family 16 glycoside hydrolase [Nitrospirota bacterium]
MNRLRKLVVGLGVFLMFVLPVDAQKIGSSAQDLPEFAPLVGVWYVEKEGATPVYVVDGTKWEQGTLSPTARKNSNALYGEKGTNFLKNIAAYKTFPLSIYREVKNFTNGTLSVSFKAISGKEDQAAGIALNIKESGEYLAVRANALENNLILFAFAAGKRSHVLDIDNVPISPQQWHTLKIVIQGNKIEGYVDDKKYLEFTLKESVSGRVGLWSKADSHVLFKSFTVQSK